MHEDELAAARREIDRIDRAMHGLLMERGAVIGRIVAAKRPGASAFRPSREAAVLRALAERHRGPPSLDAAEAMWRAMMAAFVAEQGPFTLHGEAGVDADAMRDAARFQFGFAAPYRAQPDAAAVIGAVAAAPRDLGLIALRRENPHSWWAGLEPRDAPKIVAKLPFLPRPAHPAGLPLVTVARAATVAGEDECVAYSVRLAGEPDPDRWAAAGLELLAAAPGAALVATGPGAAGRDATAFAADGADRPPVVVGAFPRPYAVNA